MESDNPPVEVLRDLRERDPAALDALFAKYHGRLRQMVRLRLDARIRSRVDPSDVVQDTCLEAYRRLGEYLERPEVPFFVWLRFLAGQRLLQVYRAHLGTQARDVRREERPFGGRRVGVSSGAIAREIVDSMARTASSVVAREELRERILDALERLHPIDREILALRHFERLTNQEAAHELGLTKTAAANRYIRALGRLKTVLAQLPGGLAALE